MHRLQRGLLIILAGLWLVAVPHAHARTSDGQDAIARRDLPVQAQRVLAAIKAGGPFHYPRKDGSVFGNRERRLPMQPRGYYREYTVKTPGSRDRGPRRIIAGIGQERDVRTSNEYWYTDNHYASFRRIVEQPPSDLGARP